MSGGLRILCLDGGGTRGLSTMYLLREIMDRIVPGRGGSVRPSEYFDIIGACGPNGLIALLFTKFSFTIDEAIDFFHDLSRRLDNAENVLEAREGEELDEDDWTEMIEEAQDLDVVIETVRRQVICNTFRDVVIQRVTDWLEKSENKDGNEFSYKCPSAVVGVGRCRAAVMGSESPGHGPDKGVVKDRVYHTPIWHKSYVGRHTHPTYTFWAIGLGTMGSPGIVSNGVIFDDFWATGAHSDHNPVQLLLQECYRIWPGLKAKVIISIGTGKLDLPESWDAHSHPHSLVAAQACFEICKENQKKASDIEKYVLPYDEILRSGYFRFDVSSSLPFFEFEAKDSILVQTLEYIKTPNIATSAARAAAMLEEEIYPVTWEDQVVLSSLAALLLAFISNGYLEEAQFVSDSISNYVLYENTKIDSGSHRKMVTATSADHIAMFVKNQISWGEPDLGDKDFANPFSMSFYLNSIMAYGEFENSIGGIDPGEELPWMVHITEYPAAAYYILTVARRHIAEELQSTLFTSVLQQVSSYLEMLPDLTPALISRLEFLLQISSFATVCEAAVKEALSDEPRMIMSSPFIRHFTQTILRNDLTKVHIRILEPIANVISMLIRLRSWSTYRDPLLTKLLSLPVAKTTSNWSLVNLAVERLYLSLESPSGDANSECTALCQSMVEQRNIEFRRSVDATLISVERGYIGLLRKVLEGDDLNSPPHVYLPRPCATASSVVNSILDEKRNNLLHLSARNGNLLVHKMIVERLGTVQSKPALSSLNHEGLAPIHIACQKRGHRNILLLCLYGGGNINQLDAMGRAPLHHCLPEKKSFNEYLPALEDFIQKNGLLLTLPVRPGCIWGTMYNNGKEIDNRTHILRMIIRQLYCRGGSTTIQDREGLTPAHLAAKNGWGIICDLFFIGSTAKAEEEAEECLRLRDKNNNSVLAMMRIAREEEGERIISAEMRKRCMDISIEKNPQREQPVGPSQSPPFQNYLPSPGTVHVPRKQVSPTIPSPPPPQQLQPQQFTPSPRGSTQSGKLPTSQTLPYHQRGPSADSPTLIPSPHSSPTTLSPHPASPPPTRISPSHSPQSPSAQWQTASQPAHQQYQQYQPQPAYQPSPQSSPAHSPQPPMQYQAQPPPAAPYSPGSPYNTSTNFHPAPSPSTNPPPQEAYPPPPAPYQYQPPPKPPIVPQSQQNSQPATPPSHEKIGSKFLKKIKRPGKGLFS